LSYSKFQKIEQKINQKKKKKKIKNKKKKKKKKKKLKIKKEQEVKNQFDSFEQFLQF